MSYEKYIQTIETDELEFCNSIRKALKLISEIQDCPTEKCYSVCEQLRKDTTLTICVNCGKIDHFRNFTLQKDKEYYCLECNDDPSFQEALNSF